jgi:hypothetical protein
MITMRQRILLVAGWVIAAVVTSLVASGAVAAAGGQVADRPLRPLTAAEVAALPVVVTADVSGPCEPLASGGFVCQPDSSTAGEVADGPGERNDSGPTGGGEGTSDGTPPGVPPAPGLKPLPDGRPLPITGIPEPEDPETTGPDLSPVPSESAVVRLAGGTVSVAGSGSEIYFLWAIAQPGYLSDVQFGEEANRLVVVFSSSTNVSVLEATWEEDELILNIFEGAL